MQISPYLQRFEHSYGFYCPSCKVLHTVRTDNRHAHNWIFDGNVNKPTFNPSVKVEWPQPDVNGRYICHFFVRSGKLEYCGDTTDREYSGKIVDLPELPTEWQDPEYYLGNV